MSIWRTVCTVDFLNATGAGTLAEHLGIVFTEIGADYVRATMPVDGRTRQPFGLLHGGASVALAETVGSIGAMMCVDASRQVCVGQEINANHVRSARQGRVTATGRPAHLGRRTHVWTIEIVEDSGALVCISRMTMAVLDRERSATDAPAA